MIYVKPISDLSIEDQQLLTFNSQEDAYIECDEDGNCNPIISQTFTQEDVDNSEEIEIFSEE